MCLHNVNIISWIAKVGGYAIYGYRNDDLKLFHLMKLHLETNPNNIIFVLLRNQP